MVGGTCVEHGDGSRVLEKFILECPNVLPVMNARSFCKDIPLKTGAFYPIYMDTSVKILLYLRNWFGWDWWVLNAG